MANAVEFAGVSVSRGKKPVVRSVDLQIATGKITGLLGPSGAGKTTLLRTIVGIQANVTGSIRVLGEKADSGKLRQTVRYGNPGQQRLC